VENFQPIFEVFATKLLDNPMFEKAGLDERQIMVGEALVQAREITHRSMETSGDYRNNRNTMIFKLTQSTSIPAIEGYIEELGMGDTELHDLTTSQLEVLKYFIDNDSDMKIEKLYRQ
jgi:type II secretory pathway predicted ATPase ExeA